MEDEPTQLSAAAEVPAGPLATVVAGRPSRRFRLSSPWRGLVERTRWLAVAGAMFAVDILLLSSTVPVGPPSSNSHARVAGSSSLTTPQSAFLPYVLNTSQYPLPDTLLNSTANISHPHITEVSYLNQSIYEVTYLQTDIHGNSTLEYLYGRYQPHLALCILNTTGCSTGNRTNLPIQWTSENLIFSLGSSFIQDTAIGSAGSLSAVAVSSNNQTRLFFAGDFGQVKTWNNPTPTPIPGISPRIAVSPSTIVLTTVSSSALYITTFHLPIQNPLTPPSQGGGGTRGPLLPTPTVTSVSPYWGTPGTPVNVYGTNFVAPATVYFGTHGVSATVLSSTHIQANAPSFPSTSPVNVTVQTSAGTSPVNWPVDLFEITSGSPPTPLIFSVVPNTALPNSSVNITGFGFTPSMQLKFGGTPALSFIVTGDNYVTATVPWGVSGPVDTQVVALGVPSLPGPTDRFTFAVSQATEPKAVAGSPVLLNPLTPSFPPTIGVLATNSSSSTVVFYNSTNGGTTFRSYKTGGAFSLSSGSSLFNQVGASRIFVGGGVSGQEATVGFGNTIFALFTTNLGNRTVVETEGSSDGGHTWTGPYASAPMVGTVRDPYATISPEGYVYVTWLENGAGPWQVDQVVYTESGRLLQAPQVIAGSGGPYGSSAFSPSVTVDGLARPLFLWGWYNYTVGGGVLRATGAFVNASTAISDLTAAFHQTQPSDYIPSDSVIKGWPANLSAFQATVNTSLALVQNDISRAKAPCPIETDVVTNLFPKLTTIVPRSVMYGEANGCGVRFGAWTTQIANDSGPLSADMYLGVYGEWLAEAAAYGKLTEPYWVGAPSQNSLYTGFSVPRPPLYLPPDQAVNASAWDFHISVNPLTVNPNTLYLNVTTWFDSEYSNRHGICGYFHTGGVTLRDAVSDSDYAVYASETVIVNGGAGGTFHPSGWAPSVYVTNLTANTTGTYEVELSVTYRQYESAWSQCLSGSQYNYNNKVVPITSGWPTSFTKILTGNFTTFLETVPEGLVVHEVGNKTTQGSDFIAWNNSMLATERTAVTGPGYSNSSGLGNTTFQIPENTGQFYVPLNQWYNATTTLTSETGGINVTGWPIRLSSNLNAGHYSTPEGYTVGCQFHEVANPVKVTWLTRNNVTNVTTSGATLTWYSNVAGTGWARYNDSQEGVYTVTATMTNESKHPEVAGYPYRYTVQVHGLSPWAWYRVTVGVSSYSGCLEYDNGAVWYIQVLSLVTLEESELPYDSVAQQGGGAQLYWSIPSQFAAGATFVNGFFELCSWNTTRNPAACNPNSNYSFPLTLMSTLLAGSQFTYHPLNSTFELNLTAVTPNTTYNVSVSLNFTLSGRLFTASSRPFIFTYARDTSGDGLTDWEKIRGWEVTYLNGAGQWVTSTATANPSAWATNGVVNDLIEKRFGLNPNTLDTAGSHMLDTWNLTFDLGAGSNPPACPTSFQCWYANTTNPFSSDPYPGHSGTGSPVSYNTTGPHTRVDDSSAYDANVLWQGSTLQYLQSRIQNESVGWLRAMVGKLPSNIDHGHWTLTVWGKLSWGANPLASSTPANGIPDGYRLTPLGGTDVNVTVTGWADSGLSQGNGVAAFIHSSSSSAPYYNSGQTNYNGYTAQVTAGSNGQANYGGDFTVTFPVVPTEQYAELNLSLIQNTGTGGGNSFSTAVGGAILAVDLFNSSSHTQTSTGNSASLSIAYQVIPIFAKAPTQILIPGDNSTLTNLPLGLQRYSGEQNFVALEIDLNASQVGSNSLQVSSIPFVNSTAHNGVSTGTYSVTLSAGMNNILIPRSYFVNSPLGQALLNGTNVTVASTTFNSFIEGSWTPQVWYARATGTTYNGVNYGPAGSYEYAKVYSNTSQGCAGKQSLCGGVPSNPAVESSNPSLAVAGVFVFNATSLSDLKDLLGGLLLNSSGNFSGWLFSATQYLPSLGLSPVVVNLLANSSQTNDGAYGAPISTQPAPQPWWQIAASVIWNAVSGVVAGLSIIWNAAIATASYIADLAVAVASWAITALNQVTSVLRQVASAILSALAALAQAILSAAEAFLSAIFSPIEQAIASFASSASSALNTAFGDIVGYAGGSVTFGTAFANQFAVVQSVVGLFGFAQPLFQTFNAVMSTLQPVFDLINPITLLTTLSGVFGFHGSNNLASHGLNLLANAAGTVLGWGFQLLSGALNAIGIGGLTLSLPTGYSLPSTSQLQGVVSGWNAATGDTTVPAVLNPLLATSTQIDSGLDVLQTAMDIGGAIAAYIALQRVLTLNFFTGIYNSFAGPLMAEEATLRIPMAEFLWQIEGVVLDVIGFLAPNNFMKFIFGALGIMLADVPPIDAQFFGVIFPKDPVKGWPLVAEGAIAGIGTVTGYYDACTAVSHCI